MAQKRIKKPHEQKPVIAEYLSRKTSIKETADNGLFVVSFKHLDKTQGLGIYQWEADKRLANTVDILSGYCQRPLLEQCDGKKFTIYGDFPKRSAFTHPSYIPEDANWARIHIDGTHIIAGHIFHNTFFVVFLDHEHQFYIMAEK